MEHGTSGPARRASDIQPVGARVYFLPVETRVPLKFGAETLRSVICCRVRVDAADRQGRVASGWGETPLSVQWAWPSEAPHAHRQAAMQRFALDATASLVDCGGFGHPLEISHDWQSEVLPGLRESFNSTLTGEALPYLAALICSSAADLALHDAFGNLHSADVYETYTRDFLNRDLSAYLTPGADAGISFAGKYPADFLVKPAPTQLPVWHLVGGLDPIEEADLAGQALLGDGYPEVLADWIRRDGLTCLKVKLRGTDLAWDYERLTRVAAVGLPLGVEHLSADFNCTVSDPEYVNEILDRLRCEQAAVFERLLYVEQPFPYDLSRHRINVHSIATRKPLFLDESAHDWHCIQLGRSLGWTGVCLKTCKTQSGSLLSLSWAKAHGMQLMVQDLTNPMLAQVPHVRLAARAGTIMGVESNAMQFYPEASLPEAAVHPGLYARRHGQLDLATLGGAGFGYRIDAIQRELPEAAGVFGR